MGRGRVRAARGARRSCRGRRVFKLRFSEALPGRGDLPALAGLTVGYALLAVVGLQWTMVPGAGTALWPAAGLAFAVLVRRGLRLWPALALGRLLAAALVGSPQPLWVDATIAIGTTLGTVIPILLIRRSGPLDPQLGSLKDMGRLVVLGAGLGSAISAGIGVLALGLGGTPLSVLPGLFMVWCFGFGVGVLLFASALLAWSQARVRRATPGRWAHLAICLAATGMVGAVVFLGEFNQPVRTWHLFPLLVWAALAFSVRGATLALMLTSGLAIYSAVMGYGPIAELALEPRARLMIAQQFAAASGVTILLLAAVADERRAKARLAASEARLRAESDALETLNQTGEGIAAELDPERVVQRVTDAGVALSGAAFGAFFYNMLNEQGEHFLLYALSGAPRSAFEALGKPRNTAVFHPTFAGLYPVRCDDITQDPRYGQSGPHFGMPPGHLPVRSYLAVPVKSRSGEVIGSLLFGHPEPGVFTERAERLMTGLAAQAAIAIDNARLYQAAQQEIEVRRRAEEHQRLLIHELNHRVKNTLATVQSIAAQTDRAGGDRDAFLERLLALSRAHDVLTRENWEGAELSAIVQGAVQPFEIAAGQRFRICGPEARLEPQPALALAMALHELATNASKYGALSQAGGRVTIDWTIRPAAPDARLELCWRETGGPPVVVPTRKGFGTRLLGRGLAAELDGRVEVDYRPDGLVCIVEARLRQDAGPPGGAVSA